jgi:hypothetical protein
MQRFSPTPTIDNVAMQHAPHFNEHGYVLLENALPGGVVAPLRRHILDELKRLDIWASGRWRSRQLRAMPVFQQVGQLGQRVICPDLQARMTTPSLLTTLEALAGQRLRAAGDAQLLLTLPGAPTQHPTMLNWHLDINPAAKVEVPGVQVFLLIDDVLPQGGATLALAGSHRLPADRALRHRLHARLNAGAPSSFTLEGIPLSRVEMCGKAGDVYLMDMRVLHSPSHNTRKTPRMMATARFLAA